MPKLSVVIITYNEERNIGRCLDSVKGLADEVVVVDSFSTDKTEEICRAAGATFIQRKWEGYSDTKNFAASRSQFDWVLSLDADEALSETLRDSILRVKTGDEPAFCEFKRLTNYCGKWIYHCGWYPDIKLRIYDRKIALWKGELHEQLVLSAPKKIIALAGDLLHYSYYTVDEHYRQIQKFTDISSREYYSNGIRVSVLKLAIAPVLNFFRNYFFKFFLCFFFFICNKFDYEFVVDI